MTVDPGFTLSVTVVERSAQFGILLAKKYRRGDVLEREYFWLRGGGLLPTSALLDKPDLRISELEPHQEHVKLIDAIREFAVVAHASGNADVARPLSSYPDGTAFSRALNHLFDERRPGMAPSRLRAFFGDKETLKATLFMCPHGRRVFRGMAREFRVATLEDVLLCDSESSMASKDKDAKRAVWEHELQLCGSLDVLGTTVPAEAYQELPLFQEVKRERLPRAGADDELEDTPHWIGLRDADLRRWEEEELRRLDISYASFTLDQVLKQFSSVCPTATSKVPRFVVLGPPGSGKSTLLQHIVRTYATPNESFMGRSLIPARIRLPHWHSVARDAALEEYLAHYYGTCEPAPTAGQWRRWLSDGHVLLLLDGLDELDRESPVLDTLCRSIGSLKHCPRIVTCRTINHEDYQRFFSDFPLFTLAGLDETQRAAYIQTLAGYEHGFDANALTEQVERSPIMQALAANPMILSLICYVAARTPDFELPATRGELYDKAVDRLLQRTRPGGKPTASGIDSRQIEPRRSILTRAAYELFAATERRRRLVFTTNELRDALSAAIDDLPTRSRRKWEADALREDLVYRGILTGSDALGYAFLHATIHEFLVATYLSNIVNRTPQAWNHDIEVDDTRCSVKRLVDCKAWDPAWHEVITLLAGRLNDPTPLLDMLSNPEPTETNPHGDDMFRHRLALAAGSLTDIPARVCARHAGTVQTLARRAFIYWWKHALLDKAGFVQHFRSTLRDWATFARGPSRVSYTTLLPGRLLSDSECVRSAAAVTLSQLASFELSAESAQRIHAALSSTTPVIRQRGADALALVGTHDSRAEFLDPLVALLSDRHGDTRRAALHALQALGKVAARIEVIESVLALFRDVTPHVRDDAIRVIVTLAASAQSTTVTDRAADTITLIAQEEYCPALYIFLELRTAAITPHVLRCIAQWMTSVDADMRRMTLYTVAELGPQAATGPILRRVAQLLDDPNPRVRRTALRAAAALGTPSLLLRVRERLFALLVGTVRDDTDVAAELLGKLSAAAWQDYVPRLFTIIHSDSAARRRAACSAISHIENGTAVTHVLSQVRQLLEDASTAKKCAALYALECVDIQSVPPDIASALTRVMRSNDKPLRHRVLLALCHVGSGVHSQDLADCIADIIATSDDSESVILALEATSVLAVGSISGRLRDTVIAQLNEDHGVNVVVAALKAVKSLPHTGGSLELARSLRCLLGHSVVEVRCYAMEAIGVWPECVTPDVRQRFTECLRDGPWPGERGAVVRAMAQLGCVVATPSTVGQLTALITDSSCLVDKELLEACEAVSDGTPSAELLQAVMRVFAKGSWWVGGDARRMLSKWRGSGAEGEIVRRMLEWTHSPDEFVVRRAISVLEDGTTMAPVTVASRLMELSKHPDRQVQHDAQSGMANILRDARAFGSVPNGLNVIPMRRLSYAGKCGASTISVCDTRPL